MKKKLLYIFILIFTTTQVYGWTCSGHTSIAQQGSTNLNACVTDNRRTFKHYVNNDRNKIITVDDFSSGDTKKGDLYKKIYDLSQKVYENKELDNTEKEDLIHLLGDLSNPMHNVIYEGYNKEHHRDYDNIDLSEPCVKTNSVNSIQNHKQFIEAAAKLANEAKRVGYLDIDGNNMRLTRDNACKLASQSAALIKAIVILMGTN